MNHHSKNPTSLKEVKAALHIQTPKKIITPRGKNQEEYLKNIESNELNFGIEIKDSREGSFWNFKN